MATAQELVDLGKSLNDFATEIDSYIESQPNPYSPNLVNLRTKEGQIASAANQVAGLAIGMLAADISAATNDLTAKVSLAQDTLKTIQTVQAATQMVATVLDAAAAAATGNPFGTAADVVKLASQIEAVLN
jgi:hypothetical protein